ncbi:GIY-YIG nuclease family protein [Pyruvatibacter sp.]|uniref:GIY-YIG nuclease family protein n=1 Tax=Pyruvatibacter sp. TaxID=1981328 RepID=UPI0032674625
MNGRSVRLYLAEGTPTGIITAEIMNWTGHVLVVPRSRIGDALGREEATRTGVYFLVGDDPATPTKSRVYVGEGDNVANRIKSHAKDETKEFWTRACIVTSKDANLTKAHVRYLESRFVEVVRESDRANVANGNDPAVKSLPESDISDMEFFLTQVQIVLPVIGMTFLRPRGDLVRQDEVGEELNPAGTMPSSRSGSLELRIQSAKHKLSASAVEQDGEVTVLAGSLATTKDDFVGSGYSSLRDQLVADGTLVKTDDPDLLKFAENSVFGSPSAAASVIFNRNTNGRTAWKLADSGQSLKDWQDQQLS